MIVKIVIKECKGCGKILLNKWKVFCSQNCYDTFRSIKIRYICKFCGQSFIPLASKKHSQKFCSKICYNQWKVGENCYQWQGGITPQNIQIRNSQEYKLWVREVFVRDEFTCVSCGIVGFELVAHHIKSFANFPGDRFVVSNGITLCRLCHRELHKQKGIGGIVEVA